MREVLRIIDANLNRSAEGLRVCEDIARFALNERKLSSSFKSLRHKIGALAKRLRKQNTSLVHSRDITRDVGRKSMRRERKRKNLADVFQVNSQRVKESLRVLEETSKLLDKNLSERFKKIRFSVYVLEKKSVAKLETLLSHR